MCGVTIDRFDLVTGVVIPQDFSVRGRVSAEMAIEQPENTTPGIAVTAAVCAGLHGLRSSHSEGGVVPRRSPDCRERATNSSFPVDGSLISPITSG